MLYKTTINGEDIFIATNQIGWMKPHHSGGCELCIQGRIIVIDTSITHLMHVLDQNDLLGASNSPVVGWYMNESVR